HFATSILAEINDLRGIAMDLHNDASGAGQSTRSSEARLARERLAACYRIFAAERMDDLIFTHLSARVPGTSDRFLFIPFGMLFEEVTAYALLEIDIAGNVTSPSIATVNPAGWVVHRTVYEALGNTQCVMHLHTVAGTAVSAQQHGLLPVNQFAVTYSGKIAY